MTSERPIWFGNVRGYDPQEIEDGPDEVKRPRQARCMVPGCSLFATEMIETDESQRFARVFCDDHAEEVRTDG